MTSTTKIIIAVIIIAVIGFVVYYMNSGNYSAPSDTAETSDVPTVPATGSTDDALSAIEADSLAEGSVAASGDDSDLLGADSQAVLELNDAYAENSF